MIAEIPLLTYEKPVPVIPTDDDLHLQSYESKLTLIRDYVRGVVLAVRHGILPLRQRRHLQEPHGS